MATHKVRQKPSDVSETVREELDVLRERLLIDQNNLDRELIEQPHFYAEIAELTVRLASRRDEAKEASSRKDSELNLSIRQDLELQGAKVTEAIITAFVATHEEHADFVGSYLTMKALAEEAASLRDAASSRGHAIRDLVSLYVNNYYAADAIRGSVQEAEGRDNTKRRKRLKEKRDSAAGGRDRGRGE